MTLQRLIEILRSIQGSGHPAFFTTPDGKKWEAVKIVQETEVTDDKWVAETKVVLKEVKR